MASRTFDAAEIVTLAARKCQVLGRYDTALDASSLDIGLDFLDLAVSELVGTEGLEHFKVIRQEFTLQTDTQAYTPTFDDPVQFVRGVVLKNGDTGFEHVVTMITADEYRAIEKKTETGRPTSVLIDHDGSQSFTFHPIPTSTQAGWTVYVDGQKYAGNLTQDGAAHGFADAWQSFLVNKLASEAGDGPWISSPKAERWARVADQQLTKLLAYNNRGNRRRPRMGKPYAAATGSRTVRDGR